MGGQSEVPVTQQSTLGSLLGGLNGGCPRDFTASGYIERGTLTLDLPCL